MGHFVDFFAIGIVAFCEFIMHYVGIVDDLFSRLLILTGITNSKYQLYVFLIFMLALVVFALRILGGLLGWVVLILLVLMLLHRVVPGISTPGGAFDTPIQNVL